MGNFFYEEPKIPGGKISYPLSVLQDLNSGLVILTLESKSDSPLPSPFLPAHFQVFLASPVLSNAWTTGQTDLVNEGGLWDLNKTGAF